MIIESNLIDIRQKAIYPARVNIQNGKVSSIEKIDKVVENYILPGFIDAHVHIESSMLVPTEFAKTAVIHGTIGTVSDPHEIANVLGKSGVYYMIENGKKVPFKFNFGAPSCVPATTFETAGAVLDAADIDELLSLSEVKYLAEMMNWPGVIFDDPSVSSILEVAQKHQKPIDGHAPGLLGEQALKYMSKGISTDHECYMLEEARFKLQNGMKVIIREGSAAKNFNTLEPLINEFYDKMMFCSDDKHPDDLIIGHINLLVKRALVKGNNLFKVLQMACINPIEHYNLAVGTLQKGDFADFIMIDSIEDFNILKTFINGELMAENGNSFIYTEPAAVVNNFNIKHKKPSDFEISLKKDTINIIEVLDGQLITNKIEGKISIKKGVAIPLSDDKAGSLSDDILKIVVVNRYFDAPVAVAFIKNFGLKRGAIASSVAHDSHNIIAVGVDDVAISRAVNLLIDNKGGLSAVDDIQEEVLPLPVAGLMSTDSCAVVAEKYTRLVKMSRAMGSTLTSPYMSLSFMALLVIPRLKLSDKGLFDGEKFEFCPIEI
jgi:adenine deaminase